MSGEGEGNGEGNGNGEGECKKITVSTFQSGKIIVTGGRNMRQIKDAYNFINNVFANNYEYIKCDISKKSIVENIIFVNYAVLYGSPSGFKS